MTLRAFVHGCWFSHGDLIWAGDQQQCLRCFEHVQILAGESLTGPKAIPDEVRGKPI